jgi:hypothetical protein
MTDEDRNQASSEGQTPPDPKAEQADVPAGDVPPKPLWPLLAGVGVWVLWVGFLVVMMVVRLRTTPV